jgi:cell wall-associated NlpC family hydrolase
MEAKECPIVSGRHSKSCRLLRLTSYRLTGYPRKLGGGLAAVAAVGATAISLVAASPADSSPKVNAISAGALAALPHTAAAPADKPRPLALADKNVGTVVKKDARALMPSADAALKLAVAQVGVTEDSAGGGTKFQKWFVASPWAERGVERDGGRVTDYANANWCDMFVSWVGAQLNVKGMGADAFTRTHAQWFKDQGRWGDAAKPGAVVFFSWNGSRSIDDIDHVGMVIKDNNDGTIQTVEGNTDNAVRVRTRDKSYVVGYGYPEYGTGSA